MPELLSRFAMLSDAIEGARSRPGRFALSLFAMTAGMAVLTAMLAILDGLEERSIRLSAELGTNVIGILAPRSSGEARLTTKHAELIRSNYPSALVAAAKHATVPDISGGTHLSVLGVDHQMAAIRQWDVERGRFLDAMDLQERSRFAVVTASLGERRHWELGSTVLLNRVPFTIVGIVAGESGALQGKGNDERIISGEHTVFVPRTVSFDWTANGGQGDAVDAIFVRPTVDQAAESVLPGMQSLLSQPGLRGAGFSWVIPETLIRGVRKMQQTVALTVGVVAALCLILGGTTLTSLLVANVRERIAEIGLRRSLGARPQDITLLFIVEGCLSTISAAVVGSLLIHFLLLQQFPIMESLPAKLGLKTLMFPMAFAIMLGVVFSWWPAQSAARIRPAEALRNE